MVMQRWDPFEEALSLRDAVNRLMEQAVLQPATDAGARTPGGRIALPLDVSESPTAYRVTASLPGVKPEDVTIQFQQGMLAISGEVQEDALPEHGQEEPHHYHIRERGHGRFYRALTLPTAIDADKARATFEHGVLTLLLPKAEAATPRRIPVQAAGAAPPRETATPPSSNEQAKVTA
jgi:HSP20 family protein